jgi:DNA-binding transcriptional LysR family regulator
MTTTQDFEIFARVARTGNMSAAGREMSLSPAVISKRVSLLEERLGARLFHRTTRQLSLTDVGQGYYRRVVDILNLIDEAQDFIARRNGRPRGPLRVTAPGLAARKLLAPHIDAFGKSFPEIELELRTNEEPVDVIGDGLDLAIVVGDEPGPVLESTRLARTERVICAAPSYLEAHGEPRTLRELESHVCLFRAGQNMWRLAGPEGQRSIKVGGNLNTNASLIVHEALLAGLGIAHPYLWEVREEIDSGRLVRLFKTYRSGAEHGIYAAFPSRVYLPAKIDSFIRFFREQLGERSATAPAPRRETLEAVPGN